MPASAGSTRTPAVFSTVAGRVGREPEVAAQPLEQRAGGEDATVERPLDLARDAPGDGRDQAADGRGTLAPDVREHEHAGAVRGFCQPCLHAAGAGQRGLLVDAARAQRQVHRP
jgi:hypothetical protein